MSEAELAALRLKLVGKLGRITIDGEQYGNYRGIIDLIEPSELPAYKYTVHLQGSAADELWYVGAHGWDVELY